jgi:hypothetical protein
VVVELRKNVVVVVVVAKVYTIDYVNQNKHVAVVKGTGVIA